MPCAPIGNRVSIFGTRRAYILRAARLRHFHIRTLTKDTSKKQAGALFQRVGKLNDTLADVEKGRDIFAKQIRRRTEVR